MTDQELRQYCLRLKLLISEWLNRQDLLKFLKDALESSNEWEEEVRRLRARCDMEASHIAELKEQIKTLRAERDEARRAWLMFMFICEDGIDMNPNGRVPYRAEIDEAESRGWDCFKDSSRERSQKAMERLSKLDEELGLI